MYVHDGREEGRAEGGREGEGEAARSPTAPAPVRWMMAAAAGFPPPPSPFSPSSGKRWVAGAAKGPPCQGWQRGRLEVAAPPGLFLWQDGTERLAMTHSTTTARHSMPLGVLWTVASVKSEGGGGGGWGGKVLAGSGAHQRGLCVCHPHLASGVLQDMGQPPPRIVARGVRYGVVDRQTGVMCVVVGGMDVGGVVGGQR